MVGIDSNATEVSLGAIKVNTATGESGCWNVVERKQVVGVHNLTPFCCKVIGQLGKKISHLSQFMLIQLTIKLLEKSIRDKRITNCRIFTTFVVQE
jgi:hypothetical protein